MALSHHAVDTPKPSLQTASSKAFCDVTAHINVTSDAAKAHALNLLNPRRDSVRGDIREIDALACLSSLFGGGEQQIAPEHYHLPLFMTALKGVALDRLLEAWVLSGLFYDYNLVVLASPDDKQTRQCHVAQHPCLNKYPQALEHLAVYDDNVPALQRGIAQYLNGQMPPFYFCEGTQDPFCAQAVQEGFLIIALDDLPWIQHDQNGFIFSVDSAKTLALQLIQVLENPVYDGELLQAMAHSARQHQ